MDILKEKSFTFALRITRLSRHLHDEKHEYVLSRKVLDSGTNIGLLIEEGRGKPFRLLAEIFCRKQGGLQNKFHSEAAERERVPE